MSVVVGLADTSYCLNKAIELISEAKTVSGIDFHAKIAKTISLLALARAQNGPIEDSEDPIDRPGTKNSGPSDRVPESS